MTSLLTLMTFGGLRFFNNGTDQVGAAPSDSDSSTTQQPLRAPSQDLGDLAAATQLPARNASAKDASVRRDLDASGVDLALHKDIDGVCLTEPRVRIIDPLLKAPIILSGDIRVAVAATPKRLLEVVADDDAWIVERTQISVGTGQRGPIEIRVKPRHRLVLNLSDGNTNDWIRTAKVQVHWESSGTNRRDASGVFTLASESGGYILEAPALNRGRVRIEAVVDDYRPERSPWIPVESDTEWVEFDLALHLLEKSTAEVLVTVTDKDQVSIPGAWVSVFEEIDDMPLIGARIDEHSLQPLRDGRVDPDLIDAPPTATTIESGLAGFKIKAPGNYRIATWVQGRGDALSEVIHFEPGETKELTLAIGATTTLQGRVLASLGDFQSGTVKRFGELRLFKPDANKSYLAALQKDGAFRFDGVAPGSYQIELTGAVDGFYGNELIIPLISREVTLGIGEDKWLELDLGSDARGQRVAGQIEFGVKLDQWAFIVGIVPLKGDSTSSMADGPELSGKRLIRANALGEFEFSGVESGHYRVVALGVRTDQLASAFLYQDVEVRNDASEQRAPVFLAPLGEPLYLQLADSEVDSEQYSVRVDAEDELNQFLVNQARPITVSAAFPSVFYGLPEGELTLRSRSKELDLVLERGSVNLIQ